MSRRDEATVSKVVSLLVKVAALIFILALPTTDIINYQTAGEADYREPAGEAA